MSGRNAKNAIDLCDDDEDVVVVDSKTKKSSPSPQKRRTKDDDVVSSRPLMEGEAEALERGEPRSWVVRPSRNFDYDVGDGHFRIAESQFKRQLGNLANQYALTQVRYVCNPPLIRRFERKLKEYDRKFGEGKHNQILAFHGTTKANTESILRQGFRMDKVGSTTDPGYFGAGIYFSELAATSIAYSQGCNQMLLCRVLLGKPFRLSTMQTGRGLEPGYTSHMTDAKGTEVVIFHEDAMLPVYVLTFESQNNARVPGSVLVPGDTSQGQNAAGVPLLPLADGGGGGGAAAAAHGGSALAGGAGAAGSAKRRNGGGRVQNSARAGRNDKSDAGQALRGLFRAVKRAKHG